MPSLKKKNNIRKLKNNIRKSKNNIRKSKKERKNKNFKGGSSSEILPFDSFLDRLEYLQQLYTNLINGEPFSEVVLNEIETLCQFNNYYSGHFDESYIAQEVLEITKGPLDKQQLIEAQQERIRKINYRDELISNICRIFSQQEIQRKMKIVEEQNSKLRHFTQFQQQVNCSQPSGFPQENCQLCMNPYKHIPEYNSFRCINQKCQMDHASLNKVRNQILNFSPQKLMCQNPGCGAQGLSLWPFSKSIYNMPLTQCMKCRDRSCTLTGATTPRGTPLLVKRPDK